MGVEFQCGFGYLTVAWTIFATLAITLSSSIAITKGHVYPWLPSISDTTVRPPEGPVFALLFNITAFLTVCLLAVRFLQVRMLGRTAQLNIIAPNLTRLNLGGFVLGFASSLGITIVANFRMSQDADSGLVAVHDVGAVLLFVGGMFYCVIQTIITYSMFRIEHTSLCLFIARLACSFLLLIGVPTFLITSVFAYDEFARSGSPRSVAQWRPEDAGYSLHVLSNLAEWLCVWCFGIFVLSFCGEFQRVSFAVQCTPKSSGSGKSADLASYKSIKTEDDAETD